MTIQVALRSIQPTQVKLEVVKNNATQEGSSLGKKTTFIRVIISDEAKFRTQPFTLLSVGSRVGRVVTIGKNVVIFCWQV